MHMQDQYGYVHDVPDSQVGEVVYDGLGNPLGFLQFLAPFLPAISSAISGALPKIGGALSSLVGGGGGGGAVPAAPGAPGLPGLPSPFAAAALPAMGGLAAGALPALLPGLLGNLFGGGGGAAVPPPPPGVLGAPAYGQPMTFAPPPMGVPYGSMRRCGTPVGWTTSALPYTGTQPRRMYMRCSVWPGQSGLVPVAPGVWPPQPGVPGMPGYPAAPFRRRHRRRR
jgi:hypothetical protein